MKLIRLLLIFLIAGIITSCQQGKWVVVPIPIPYAILMYNENTGEIKEHKLTVLKEYHIRMEIEKQEYYKKQRDELQKQSLRGKGNAGL